MRRSDAQGRADAGDLAEVDEVVPGHEPHEPPDGLLAALGVEPDAREVGLAQPAQKADVDAADRLEVAERLGKRPLGVGEPVREPVLVVARDGWSVVRDDDPEPVSGDDLGVGEVADDVLDGPLARSLGPAGVGAAQDSRRLTERGRRAGENVERVSVAELTQDGVDVGGLRWLSEGVGEGGHGRAGV